MNYLVDTHLLIWGAVNSEKLSAAARAVIVDKDNGLYCSVASLWEVAIKSALRRPDFPVDVGTLRAGLLANGYRELPVEGRHAIKYRDLPAVHQDPFDYILIAQALAEGMTLLTADRQLKQYGHAVRFVG